MQLWKTPSNDYINEKTLPKKNPQIMKMEKCKFGQKNESP
jgi:hypothetical protein